MDASQFEPSWDGSGLEDPRYIIKRFEAELTADWDQDAQGDGYGIQVMFAADGNDNKRQAVLMPWLTFLREQAHMMVHVLTGNSAESMESLEAWLSTGSVNLEAGIIWHPIAAKVVHLAVVPF